MYMKIEMDEKVLTALIMGPSETISRELGAVRPVIMA